MTVLCYHDLPQGADYSISSVRPHAFAAHLDWLIEREYRFVSSWTDRPESAHTLYLTFDDGFEDQLNAALNILAPRKVRATVFIVTDFVGRQAIWDYQGRRRRHAAWSHLESWCAQGHVVGSHGCSHRRLDHLPDAELKRELETSRMLLEDRLGQIVTELSYPFGRNDDRVRQAAHRAGYQRGYGTRVTCRTCDAMNIPRVVVSKLDTAVSLQHRIGRSVWGRAERLKQHTIRFWSGGTSLQHRLRGTIRCGQGCE